MRLNEIFDAVYPWTSIWKRKYKERFIFHTENNSEYRVYFSRDYHDNVWDIEFFLRFRDSDDGKLRGAFNITNTGDQFKVFATVIDIIRAFNNTHTGATLKFTADSMEPSRVKLYKRMYDTLIKKYNMTNVIFDMNPETGTNTAKTKGGWLREVFDNKYEWNITTGTNNRYIYKFFATENVEYQVWFEQDTLWELDFYRISTAGKERSLSINVTGTGDQFKVFATVIDIILDFKKKHPHEKIAFKAIEYSRQKLYDRMVNTLTEKYGMELMSTYYDEMEYKTYVIQ